MLFVRETRKSRFPVFHGLIIDGRDSVNNPPSLIIDGVRHNNNPPSLIIDGVHPANHPSLNVLSMRFPVFHGQTKLRNSLWDFCTVDSMHVVPR